MTDARGQTVSVRLGADGRRRRATPSSRAPARVITFRGFLLAYVEGRDEPARATTRGAACCRRSPRATRSTRDRARARGPRDHAARPLHRGERWSRRSRSAASAARRPTPRSSARSTTAATCCKKGPALVPVVPRLRGRRTCSSSTSRARRLRVHRADGGRPRRDRRRRRGAHRVAAALLLRRRTATPGLQGARSSRPRRHRRARGQLDPDRRDERHRRCASAATARTSSAASERADACPDDIAPDELTVERGRGAPRAPTGEHELGDDPETGRTIVVQDRPLRALRHRGAAEDATRSRGRRRSSRR